MRGTVVISKYEFLIRKARYKVPNIAEVFNNFNVIVFLLKILHAVYCSAVLLHFNNKYFNLIKKIVIIPVLY